MLYYFLVLLISTGDCAKILGFFTIPSISHQIVYQPIYKELSLRGHQVTVITPNPINDPTLTNLTEIDIGFSYQKIVDFSTNFTGKIDHWFFLKTISNWMSLEEILQMKEVQKLLTDGQFDVVLTEYLLPGGGAFSAKFNCPLIGVSSLSVANIMMNIAGNPTHPVIYPDLMIMNEVKSLYEKLDSLVFEIYESYFYAYHFYPEADKILRKYFGNDIPYVAEAEANISLLFLNTNPILHKPRPLSPMTIELGSTHIKPKKSLPEPLKKFLDDSQEGVIYFSLGTNVKSVNLDLERRRLLENVFARLPYKILWKFENESMEFKEKNVKIQKWLPQQDVLGHKNVKLFITQGGLQSLEEAIFNEVPMIVLPFIGDQPKNAKRIEELGIGKRLNFHEMTEDVFKESILEVITDPKYKAQIKMVHDLLVDRPMTGLQNAVWWTEYVIRHKGAPLLKSPLSEASWFEYFMVDVIGFLLLILVVSLYLVYRIFSFVLRKLNVKPRKEKYS